MDSIRALRLFGRFFHGERRFFLVSVLAVAASIFLNFLVPQIVRVAVDGVMGRNFAALPAFVRPLGELDPLLALLYCGLAVLACGAFSWGTGYVARMQLTRGTESIIRRLRNALFAHVQSLPFQWHVKTQTGDIIQRCTADVQVIHGFISGQLAEIIRTTILLITGLALMFTMHIPLTLYVLAFVPILLVYSAIFYGKIARKFHEADVREGELMVRVQENLAGVRVVKAFGRQRFELEKFHEKNNAFADAWIDMSYLEGTYWGVGDLLTGFQIIGVWVLGVHFAVNGTLTVGELIAFAAYSYTMTWPIRALGQILSEMSKTGVSAARLLEILDTEPETESEQAERPAIIGDITFENVRFAYPAADSAAGSLVLQDLNFTIPRGTTFGILGATGSGKSTITYLLSRLYDLTEDGGRITIGGTDIRNIDRRHLRRHIGLVLQEPFLFSKTIGENIAVTCDITSAVNSRQKIAKDFCSFAKSADAGLPPQGKEADEVKGQKNKQELSTVYCRSNNVNLDELRRVARIADLDEDVSGFAKGYDTIVGERGVTLSGGQKQRVAIARTLMQNAPIMVFDDSLSAVDMETDSKIRTALRENTADTTVILVSHRVTSLAQADRILVLENGKQAELGSHAELLERDGIYSRVYKLQNTEDN